jgi:hypothetical protein
VVVAEEEEFVLSGIAFPSLGNNGRKAAQKTKRRKNRPAVQSQIRFLSFLRILARRFIP